jgi:hypothetical protein
MLPEQLVFHVQGGPDLDLKHGQVHPSPALVERLSMMPECPSTTIEHLNKRDEKVVQFFSTAAKVLSFMSNT